MVDNSSKISVSGYMFFEHFFDFDPYNHFLNYPTLQIHPVYIKTNVQYLHGMFKRRQRENIPVNNLSDYYY